MKIDEEQIKSYLFKLFGLKEGYCEFRLIGPTVERKFFKAPFNHKNPISFIKKYHQKEEPYHMFVSVNLRMCKQSKERFVKQVDTLFVDLDAKDFEGGKQEAKSMLKQFSLPPSFVIDSGHGYHGYWILDEPHPIHHKGDINYAKQISAKLHKELKADATHDLSRILRVPGTVNIKDKPLMCQFDSISFNRYHIEQLDENLPNDTINLTEKADLDFNTDSDIESIENVTDRVPLSVIERAKDRPERFDDDRSANDYHVAVRLFEHGLNDQEVKDCFKIFALNDFDAGLKFKEDGEKYMNHTIASAKDEYDRRKEKYNSIDSIEIIEE